MASFSLTGSTFPNGTSVGAYPASQWLTSQLPPTGAAPGAATASATVTAGTAAFTGLADSTRYYAGAQVNSVWRYVGFETPTPDPAGSGIPVGGADGQVLTKQSATDGDALWETPAAGVTTNSPVIADPAQATGSGDQLAYLQGLMDAYLYVRIPRGTSGNAWRLSAPLVCSTGQKLDCTDATFNLTGVKRFVTNDACIAGTGRDSDITIIGGTWARGANAGTTTLEAMSLMFAFVDGIKIRDVTVTSSAGKYAIHLYMCTNFDVGPVTFNVFSDGVHITDCSNGRIGPVYGTTGDDSVAIMTRDGPTTWEIAGAAFTDMGSIVVDGVYTTTIKNGVKVLSGIDGASAALNVRNITVRNVDGAFSIYGVWLGGDSNYVTLGGGTLDGITVENVRNTAADAVRFIGPTTTFRGVRLRNVKGQTGHVYVNTGTTVEDVEVADTSLIWSGNRYLFNVLNGGVVTRAVLRNIRMGNGSTGSGMVSAASGSTLTHLILDNVHNQRSAWGIGDFFTTTAVWVRGLVGDTQTGYIHTNSGAVVTVREATMQAASGDDSNVAAGGTITSYALGFRCDMSKLVRVAGGQCWNTNAALTPASGTMIVGPWVCDGTTWKSLTNAATY